MNDNFIQHLLKDKCECGAIDWEELDRGGCGGLAARRRCRRCQAVFMKTTGGIAKIPVIEGIPQSPEWVRVS